MMRPSWRMCESGTTRTRALAPASVEAEACHIRRAVSVGATVVD